MAGPISGLSVQQSSLAQSLQQGNGNEQLRESNARVRESNVSSSEDTSESRATSETKKAESESSAQPSLQSLREEAFRDEEDNKSKRPGSLVDILV